ncbi:MAG TPA: NAD(P)-dependent alcohol dehydrogenase [Candidatus Limnocylindrales bacterium]
MKTVVQSGYGDPARVLRFVDEEVPTPTDEQVLVRVVASSVNSADWRQVLGIPRWARLMMGGLRGPRDARLGVDAAGVVEAVGSAVTHVKPGDEVFGARSGAFAEVVAGKSFVAKPANLSLAEAAALPVAALTALQGLRDQGRLEAGQSVLLNGAGGGVGHLAVQIGKALGAHVTAVTRTDKLELVRRCGADTTIDYSTTDIGRLGDRFDLVVDIGSPKSLGVLRRLLKPTGTFVQIGAAKGFGGTLGRIATATVRRRVIGQRVQFFIAKVNTADLDTLRGMAEAGQLRPIIERSYPLEQVADAIAYAATEQVGGKIAIKVAR